MRNNALMMNRVGAANASASAHERDAHWVAAERRRLRYSGDSIGVESRLKPRCLRDDPMSKFVQQRRDRSHDQRRHEEGTQNSRPAVHVWCSVGNRPFKR